MAATDYPTPGALRTIGIISEALRAAGGVITFAAQKLGIARSTLYSYLAACPELQQVRKDVDNETLDLAEGHLIKLIVAGDREAIKFYLRCKGKARGWVERIEATGPSSGPIAVRDVSKLSNEQLEAIVRGEIGTDSLNSGPIGGAAA